MFVHIPLIVMVSKQTSRPDKQSRRLGGMKHAWKPKSGHRRLQHLLPLLQNLHAGTPVCTHDINTVTAFMGSVFFCVGGYLPVLLDASFATTANAEKVISHLISLDVAGMM